MVLEFSAVSDIPGIAKQAGNVTKSIQKRDRKSEQKTNVLENFPCSLVDSTNRKLGFYKYPKKLKLLTVLQSFKTCFFTYFLYKRCQNFYNLALFLENEKSRDVLVSKHIPKSKGEQKL